MHAGMKIAVAGATGRVGRHVVDVVDVAMLLAARRGDPVTIEAGSDPADPDRDLFESGALLPGPRTTLAGPTFEEWLDAAPPSTQVAG
jgi:nucleoside-diphosphate-sugar epimerase